MKSGRKSNSTLLRTSKLFTLALLGAVQLFISSIAQASPPRVTSLSPASSGGKIAFDSMRDGGHDIYIMNADGTNQTRLTTTRDNTSPSLSRDGSKIVFNSLRAALNRSEFYTMNADGTNVKRLTFSGSVGYASWSPNGNKIAYLSYQFGFSNPEFYVMDADGTNQIRLTNNNFIEGFSPTWSPDGSQIAFTSYRSGRYGIYIVNADGTNERPVFATLSGIAASGCSYPSWSPTSAEIAFSGADGNLYIVSTNGTNLRQLTNKSGGSNIWPTWSPDGTEIAFTSSRVSEQWSIYKIKADGTGQTLVTPIGGYDYSPSWGAGNIVSAGQPTAYSQLIWVTKGQSISFTLRAFDPEGDPLNYSIVTPPVGTLIGDAPNLTYIAHPDYTGSDEFTFKVNDGKEDSAIATVRIVINEEPVISTVSDQDINQDGVSDVLPFTINDDLTLPEDLIVTATSDNSTLIPNSGIVLGGSQGNRTIQIKPKANQLGAANITIQVTEPVQSSEANRMGGLVLKTSSSSPDTLSTKTTFKVTVKAANEAPTISSISEQKIRQNATLSGLIFLLSDKETAVENLKVTVSSSNPTLFGSKSLTMSGLGVQRTLTLKPQTNAVGTATITLKVQDAGGKEAQTSFDVIVEPAVTAPTITTIPDQTVNEDSNARSLNFFVGDRDTPAENLKLNFSSSNQLVISNTSLVFSGTGSMRTLTFQPRPNAYGEATVTVRVFDSGNLSATSTFKIVVLPVNDAPTISVITNKTIFEDVSSYGINFNLQDIDTPLANLQVTATSSNQSLVDDSSIVLSGTAALRTLTLKPLLNANGTTTITVKVMDGLGGVAQTSFVFTVTAVNDIPTVSALENQTLNEGSVTEALPFTVSDVETPAADLLVTVSNSNATLFPAGSIVLGGSGSNRTIKFTPAAYKNGTATVTLKVLDGENRAKTTSFLVTVLPVNDAPTISAIADRNINEDAAATAIGLKVEDIDTSIANVILTANSSNEALIPTSSLVLGGTSTQRALTLKPLANASGVTTITLKATDDKGASKTVAFLVTVKPVNDAPVALPQTLNAVVNQPLTINLTGTDIDSDDLRFEVTTVPANGSIKGAAPTIIYTPKAVGTTTLVFRARDPQGAVSASAKITIVTTSASVS